MLAEAWTNYIRNKLPCIVLQQRDILNIPQLYERNPVSVLAPGCF
jgi:hypothetical protein